MNKNTRKKTALSLMVLALVSFTVAFFSIEGSVSHQFKTPGFAVSTPEITIGGEDFELAADPYMEEIKYDVTREDGFVDNIEQKLTVEYEMKDKDGEAIDGISNDKPLVIKLDGQEMLLQEVDSNDSKMTYTIDLDTLAKDADPKHEESYELSIQLANGIDQSKYQGVNVDIKGIIDAQQAAPARFGN